MRTPWRPLACALALVGLMGCGATVGDECTVDDDCGDEGFCITGAEGRALTPGGYCSRPCVPATGDDFCPSGSVCVSRGARSDVSACFRRCDEPGDCREGYTCRGDLRDDAVAVCAGGDPP